MPSQVRIIRERNSAKWDDLVRDIIGRDALRQQHTYFGIVNNERADRVRRAIRTAAKHQGYASQVYWTECPDAGKCKLGGSDCAFHVNYTLFTLEEGRATMGSRSRQNTAGRR